MVQPTKKLSTKKKDTFADTTYKACSISESYLANFYQLVWKYSGYKRAFDPKNLDLVLKRSLPSIAEIWRSYNCDRESLSGFNFNTPKYSFSYLVGFHLPNVARFKVVFDRMIPRINPEEFLKYDTVNIWDIGCGSGACSSSFIDSFLDLLDRYKYKGSSLKFKVHLVDRASHFLTIAQDLISSYLDTINLNGYSYNIEYSISTYRSSIESFTPRSDFISSKDNELNVYIAGYVYNEISQKQKGSAQFEKLVKKMAGSGSSLLFLLDPANQTPSKNLTSFKDRITNYGFYTLYPCSFESKCCPLLDKKDWCFTEAYFKKDRLTQLVDNSLKTQRSKINTCSFILTNNSNFINKELKSPVTLIGKPIIKADRTQSHIQYLLCDGKGVFKKEDDKSSLLKGELYKKN